MRLHDQKSQPVIGFDVRQFLQVGQSVVLCNTTVLTAQAYAAITKGTCSPACGPIIPCSQVIL